MSKRVLIEEEAIDESDIFEDHELDGGNNNPGVITMIFIIIMIGVVTVYDFIVHGVKKILGIKKEFV